VIVNSVTVFFSSTAIVNPYVSAPYPSSFKSPVRWLHSLTRITYFSKLIGIRLFAAFLRLE